MVSKDERAAQLLDVLEGLQDKYASMAKEVSLSFLISALNVLSEAEASFRIARNKRLHVELTLIKLCYLQQAIDMAVSQEGEVIKKKRVDGPIAFKSVPIEPLQLKKVSEGSTGGATLKVQTQKEHYVTQPAHQVHTEVKKTQATPPLPAVSATSTGITNTVQIPPSAPVVGTDGRKLKLLDQLKEKQLQDMAARSQKEERNPVSLHRAERRAPMCL